MNSTFGVQNTARKHGQPISGCCPFPWLVNHETQHRMYSSYP